MSAWAKVLPERGPPTIPSLHDTGILYKPRLLAPSDLFHLSRPAPWLSDGVVALEYMRKARVKRLPDHGERGIGKRQAGLTTTVILNKDLYVNAAPWDTSCIPFLRSRIYCFPRHQGRVLSVKRFHGTSGGIRPGLVHPCHERANLALQSIVVLPSR